MAKKRRSAKQKAATRKLVALNRRRGKPKRRKSSPKRKGNKRRRTSQKRSKTTRRTSKKSLIDKVPVLRNKTVQKVAFGLGMGVIAIQLINLIARFAPPAIAQPLVQNQRVIKLGVEAITEPISAAADLLLTSGALTRVGGGNSRNGGMNTEGFA